LFAARMLLQLLVLIESELQTVHALNPLGLETKVVENRLWKNSRFQWLSWWFKRNV